MTANQIEVLRKIEGRAIYLSTLDLDGNLRRTVRSLSKRGLVEACPIIYGEIRLTEAGKTVLAKAEQR